MYSRLTAAERQNPMEKTHTRYRVTVGETVKYRDTKPDDAWFAQAEAFSQNRGVTIKVEECHTTINAAAPIGQKIIMDDRTIWQMEY